jgi:hypothetical protein
VGPGPAPGQGAVHRRVTGSGWHDPTRPASPRRGRRNADARARILWWYPAGLARGCATQGGSPAKGGTITLYLSGDKTGEGRAEATVPLIFSADETADVGRDTASPVSDDYDGKSSVFTGTVNWVHINLGEDAEDFARRSSRS